MSHLEAHHGFYRLLMKEERLRGTCSLNAGWVIPFFGPNHFSETTFIIKTFKSVYWGWLVYSNSKKFLLIKSLHKISKKKKKFLKNIINKEFGIPLK